MSEIEERLQFSVKIACEAGDGTLSYFRRSDLAVERKADQSPVTVADRAAEEMLRNRIGERFPDDGIIGEELGEKAGQSGFQWILDPIDGTKSFIHGVPLYTTLVAVLQNDKPQIGVIHAPAVGETAYAAVGAGCWYLAGANAKPVQARVSDVATVRESLVLTTEIKSFAENRRSNALDLFLRLQQAARVSRTWGDGYGYLMVAIGRAEVMIDPIVNLWDAAALQPVIEEAGGHFGDWDGNATIRAGEAIATNARERRGSHKTSGVATSRQRVLGIGGVLFRAREPKTLVEWYQQTLGVPVETGETYGALFSSDGGGPTVWSAFSTDADYFGRGEQQVMINYRVRNLDAMLAQLRVGRMAAF